MKKYFGYFPRELLELILKYKTVEYIKSLPACKHCDTIYEDGSYQETLKKYELCGLCVDKYVECFKCSNLIYELDMLLCEDCGSMFCEECDEIFNAGCAVCGNDYQLCHSCRKDDFYYHNPYVCEDCS